MSDEPIRVGHADLIAQLEDLCGCCEGTALSTLEPVLNRPGLGAIRYRVGEHGTFKASMLAQLASSKYPALLGLGTREDDDFSIALIDAWATVCDVLSFYQERHANEAFVGTARERFSINEIARLIGYRLHPGSAAETDLMILMEDPPGAQPDVASLTVPAGTRVQSLPGPEEEPQTFETLAALDAKVAWNALRPRQQAPVTLTAGATGMWLDGQATGLSKGDRLLIAHPRRVLPGSPNFSSNSMLWDVVRLAEVSPDADLDRTWVSWESGLGTVTPADDQSPSHRVYALRKEASLFGYNAPHPLVLTYSTRVAFGFTGGTVPDNSPSTITGDLGDPGDWDFADDASDTAIALDAVYKEFVAGGWAVLALPGGTQELYGISAAATDATSKFAISGKATRITPDKTGWVATFASKYRQVTVLGGSEELKQAETPLFDAVFGTEITLDGTAAGLPEDRTLIVSGRRAQVLTKLPGHLMLKADGTWETYLRGTRMTLAAPPFWWPGIPNFGFWLFIDPDGDFALTLGFKAVFEPVEADEDTPEMTEKVTLDRVEAVGNLHSKLVFKRALVAAYDRASLKIHANIARVSHGETSVEILGGGDPARPFQSATLKQNPITHLVASTENGVASTLTLRIDGVEWDEKPDLYDRESTARIFTTLLDDEGKTTVQFGDGASGARPPAGRDNIQAEYRKGLGLGGNVRSGQLTLALDKPLGLKEVTNPLPATGGADAETSDAARRNAPIYTLTLGRVVSLTDYRDFALGYPGIAKADARWVWQGEARRIVVTVAGDKGAAVPRGGPVHSALLTAFRKYGDPLATFDLLTFQQAQFRVGLKVVVDAAHDPDVVLLAVESALRAAYAFDKRDFAQPVALSDVAATAHGVAGVVAVDIDKLYRETGPQSDISDHMLLESRTGRRGDDGSLKAAEILTLSTKPFDGLEVMA